MWAEGHHGKKKLCLKKIASVAGIGGQMTCGYGISACISDGSNKCNNISTCMMTSVPGAIHFYPY